MVDPTATTGNEAANAKDHFAKAMDEAKAGAQALGKEARTFAEGCREKVNHTRTEWTSEAKARSEDVRTKANTYAADAKVKANELALDGKAKASQCMVSLSKLIDENASLVDEKAGIKYGDYARTASKTLQETATKLDEKSLEELGEDAKEFVRQSPGLAVGMAVAVGFLVGRMFKSK